MLRSPIFYLQAETGVEYFDVYQNYLCPHFDLCKEEARNQELSLNCGQCGFNEDRGVRPFTEAI